MEISLEADGAAGLGGLRVWAESREAQARRRESRIRFTARILNQNHVAAGVFARPAE
jgi:hypothetical protein